MNWKGAVIVLTLVSVFGYSFNFLLDEEINEDQSLFLTVEEYEKEDFSLRSVPCFRDIEYDIVLPDRKVFDTSLPISEFIDSLHWYAAENAWRLFIAINWPIDQKGQTIDTVLNGDYATMWDFWPTQNEVFISPNEKHSWREKYFPSIPGSNKGKRKLYDINVLKDYSFIPNNLEGDDRDSLGGNSDFCTVSSKDVGKMLYDQKGKPVSYTVSYHPFIYNFILEKNLYKPEGQLRYFNETDGEVADYMRFLNGYKNAKDPKNEEIIWGTSTDKYAMFFPLGIEESETLIFSKDKRDKIELKRNIGSIVIKTSWKEISRSEMDRYHVKRKIDGKQDSVLLGLVGMHIGRKAKEAPTWVWATFEHIDNCPEKDANGNVIKDINKKYSFYNTSAGADTITPNRFRGENMPAQIVREIAILKQDSATNVAFHKLLMKDAPKSIWLNYKLVGMQWPVNDRAIFASNCNMEMSTTDKAMTQDGNPFPKRLANTTIEPFIQTESSCYGCHANKAVITIQNRFGRMRPKGYDFMISATRLHEDYQQAKK